MRAARDLTSLFDPASVALVGASATPGKWGNILAQTVLTGEHRRRVMLVNRRGGRILDRPAYRSLDELPESPELVMIVVPEQGFEEAVAASLDAGARAIVAIVAGLGEAGPENRRREQAVVERVRAAGAVLLGPNCMGVIDTTSELSAAAHLTLPAGELAVVTQSGGLGLELGRRATHAGVGFSRFVSLGNQADLTAADVVRELARHEPSRVIALYLEDMHDGRDLARAALDARRQGTHVVLLAPGRTDATARAASSHTGSLAGSDETIDALCAAAGIHRVGSTRELFDTAVALVRPRFPRGRRLAVITDGGGAAVVASSLAQREGFEVPELSDDLSAALAAVSNPLATVRNPLDLLADDPDAIAAAFELIAASGEVDAALVSGVYGYTASRQYPSELGDLSELEAGEVAAAARIGATAEARDFPTAAATIATPSPVVDELARHGVPMYRDVEAATAALGRLARDAETVPHGVPELPDPEPTAVSATYEDARELLAAAGIQFPECRFVGARDEALAAADAIGFPVVLKALGTLHKSDAGGVAVDIRDAAALADAFDDIDRRLAPERLSVERMAPVASGVELIVGARWDARLGPVLVVGLGGIFTETLRDVRTVLAPAPAAVVADLLGSLRGAELLRGARGRRPVDLDAVARLAADLSRVAAAHPEMAAIEINPVLALPDGAIALDARLVPAAAGDRALEGVA